MRKQLWLLLALILCATFVFTACGETTGNSSQSGTVTKIEVTTQPTKTEYQVGDTFELDGGKITVTYDDGKTEEIDLTAAGVSVITPDLSGIGQKTVSVTYNKKVASFKVTVVAKKVAITLNYNYTGSQDGAIEVEVGSMPTPPQDPTREGYKFLGWYTSADGSEKFNFNAVVSEAATAYAQWQKMVIVTFNYNYQGADPTTVTDEAGKTVQEPADPTREGYVFTGWYQDAECKTVFNFATAINENTVIYAGWNEAAAEMVSVTLERNDGTTATVRQIEKGEVFTKPADPVKAGYEFGGWFTDNETFANAFNFANPVTANVTIYAKWTLKNYVLTYYYNHATNEGVYTTVDVAINAKTSKPTDPVIDGYLFDGWYTDTACTTAYNFTERVNDFANLYAKWLKTYTFEAEYTDMDGKQGLGYSENQSGVDMIVADTYNAKASNGYFVTYLYYQGAFLEFDINSDKAVTDAVISLRLSAEFYDMYLNKSNFTIEVNGVALDYNTQLNITDVYDIDHQGADKKRAFEDFRIDARVSLRQGANVIKLIVSNDNKQGDTGTMNAAAPMIDCIYVYSSSELTWTPKTSNIGK